MSDTHSSPARAPSKVTYAGRAKRKRRATDATYKDTGPSEEDTEEEEFAQPAKLVPIEKRRGVSSPKDSSHASSFLSMATRTPKKVDVHLPGPSPRRVQNEPTDQSTSVKKSVSTRGKKGAHSRAGSVASLAREDTLAVNDASPTKPLSSTSVKTHSQAQRKDTPEDGADDVSSVGDTTRRVRKTEAERRQFFEEDPTSGEVEPHRVFCTRCNEWVDLNPKLKFIMKRWLEHRKQCKGGADDPTSPGKEPVGEDLEDDGASVAGASVVGTPITGVRRVKKEDDRKTIIEADPLAGEVHPDMVLCKGCQQWVKLSKETRYSLNPWRSHTQKCYGAVPSTRVATAQRKLNLLNDSQVKSYNARSVDCKSCDAKIVFEKVDYDLTKWEEHKGICSGGRPPAQVKLAESSSSSVLRPPPSVASTEDTVVATETTTPQKGTKRLREDDDVPDRSTRQRGASYEPPQGESPGFLNWITAPIKNFLRGFREGLSG